MLYDLDRSASDEEGVPSSHRIVQDCDRAIRAMEVVYENNGEVVPGLANRNGNRYDKRGTLKHGGARVKSNTISSGRFVHPVVRCVVIDRREKILTAEVLRDELTDDEE